MFKTIIWVTDGAEVADRALPYAQEPAEGQDKNPCGGRMSQAATRRAAWRRNPSSPLSISCL